MLKPQCNIRFRNTDVMLYKVITYNRKNFDYKKKEQVPAFN